MTLTRQLLIGLAAASSLTSTLTFADKSSARNQYFAQEYRVLCELTAKPFETAQSPDEATQQSLSISRPIAKTLKLNQSGRAYLNLSVENWDEKLVVFHNKGINIGIKGADFTGQDITNQQCHQPDMTISHVNTHEWGSYPVTISGQPNAIITLKIYQEQSR